MDEPVLRRLDQAAKVSYRARSNLFRMALTEWLAAGRQRQLAAEDRAGYVTQPVVPGEFDGLIAAQGDGIRDR